MSRKTDAMAETARNKVQEKFERDERNHHILMLRQRVEVARAGVTFYQHGKYKEALEYYYKYLGILERWKKVKSGELEPKHFDSRRDIAELLLLSGIFWDIAKLQDRSKKKDKNAVRKNLDKFVAFSKGMPYQHMCAELVRKYLMNEKAINRSMFKDTYMRLGGGKCFIATAVEDFCAPHTLGNLRLFRDHYLLKKTWGRTFVQVYYGIGPYLARAILKTPIVFQKGIAKVLDYLAKDISNPFRAK